MPNRRWRTKGLRAGAHKGDLGTRLAKCFFLALFIPNRALLGCEWCRLRFVLNLSLAASWILLFSALVKRHVSFTMENTNRTFGIFFFLELLIQLSQMRYNAT